jgi:hypothetical protein
MCTFELSDYGVIAWREDNIIRGSLRREAFTDIASMRRPLAFVAPVGHIHWDLRKQLLFHDAGREYRY